MLVTGQESEALAAFALADAHRAELVGQADRLGPGREFSLHQPVGFGVVGEHLEPRAGADDVVGQR